MNSEMVRCEIEADGTQVLSCQANSYETEATGTQPLKNKNYLAKKKYVKTKCILQSIGWRITWLLSCFNIKRW